MKITIDVTTSKGDLETFASDDESISIETSGEFVKIYQRRKGSDRFGRDIIVGAFYQPRSVVLKEHEEAEAKV